MKCYWVALTLALVPPIFLAAWLRGNLNPVPALLVGEEGNGFVLYGLGSGLGRVVQGIGVGAGGIVFIMTNTIHQDRTIRFMSSDCDCSTSSRARPEELSS
jgi:hypothetical protein